MTQTHTQTGLQSEILTHSGGPCFNTSASLLYIFKKICGYIQFIIYSTVIFTICLIMVVSVCFALAHIFYFFHRVFASVYFVCRINWVTYFNDRMYHQHFILPLVNRNPSLYKYSFPLMSFCEEYECWYDSCMSKVINLLCTKRHELEEMNLSFDFWTEDITAWRFHISLSIIFVNIYFFLFQECSKVTNSL